MKINISEAQLEKIIIDGMRQDMGNLISRGLSIPVFKQNRYLPSVLSQLKISDHGRTDIIYCQDLNIHEGSVEGNIYVIELKVTPLEVKNISQCLRYVGGLKRVFFPSKFPDKKIDISFHPIVIGSHSFREDNYVELSYLAEATNTIIGEYNFDANGIHFELTYPNEIVSKTFSEANDL